MLRYRVEALFLAMNDVVLQGWLDKKGRIMKTWRRRWVVLRSSKLEYFVDQDCTRKKGELILTPDTRVLSRDGRRHHHKFSIWTRDRLLHCSAYNTDDREDWINVLEDTIRKLQPVNATKTSPEKRSEVLAEDDEDDRDVEADTSEVNDGAVDFVHELGISLRDLPNIDDIR